MKFTRRLPTHKSLIPIVRSYWILNIESGDVPFSQLYFPYGSFELVYYISGRGIMQYVGTGKKFKQPESCYSGQFTKPFFLHFDRPCMCLGVSLKPWAGNTLFNVPSNKFTDEMVELTDLGGNDLDLDPFSGDGALFAQVERSLLKKFSFYRLDDMSAHLARTLLNSPDRYTANQAIASIGYSRRRIEQKFLSSTGLNIGSFCRKIRFQKAVDLLSNHQKENTLTELGLSAGYYDQSHFISEFKEFTSITPLAFLKQKNDLQKFLASLSSD